ncbi:WD repeat-containing protein 74-like isoform X4 [Mobula birostris]|uniref:WD repeat-containing protein 74-like isoform X4 n=1 Tax=Mobula birostris TaxID=1983395 RepID=UPI003B28676D
MRQNPERREHVATGGKENELRVWDLQRPQETVFTAKNVRNDWLDLRVPVWVRDVHFIPASGKLVTCTGHSQVRVYDPSAQRRPVLEMTYGEVPLTALSLTPDANSVIVGNTHGHLAVLDLRKGQLLRCLKGQAGSVRSVQCHPSLPFVASCGLDRFLRVHNVVDGKLVHKEDVEPGVDADVKEEEVDEIWDSMVTVGSQAHPKRKAEQPRQVKRKKAGRDSQV